MAGRFEKEYDRWRGDETMWGPQGAVTPAVILVDEPQRQGGIKFENLGASEKGLIRELTVLDLLTTHLPFSDGCRTGAFSQADWQGRDLELQSEDVLVRELGCPQCVPVQVKSSRCGINSFLDQAEQHGFEWVPDWLLLLDGSEPEYAVVADAAAQILVYAGLWYDRALRSQALGIIGATREYFGIHFSAAWDDGWLRKRKEYYKMLDHLRLRQNSS